VADCVQDIARGFKKMSASFDNLPRFRVGDRVRVTSPTKHRGVQGLVMEVVEHNTAYDCSYRVQFPDWETATFSEFDLALV
jgi:hypothetical protein